jgi:predicted regulator of Ras-like GTPase activity (Roadblock/LC7/MglB family)
MIEISTKRQKLESILSDFVEVGDVEGVAVVTRDGLLVASRLPRDVDPGVFSAMSAAMQAAGETSIKELKKGSCQTVSAESNLNIIMAYSLDSIRILVALFNSQANLGLIRLELFKTAEELRKVL